VAGDRTRIDARDGEIDTVDCGGESARDLLLDVGADRAARCVRPAGVFAGRRSTAGRRRSGSLVPFTVSCAAAYHPCRVHLRPRLTRRGTRRGRPLPPLTVRVPAAGSRRAAVRLPAGATAGPRVLRFAVRNASPFRGVAPWRGRAAVPLRVVGAR
jgi:hypothetical protein